MTVSSAVAKKLYAGNGVTTAFATTFQFFDNTDIVVTEIVDATGVETVKTLTTHYTVSGGDGATGTVTMLTAPASGVTLVLEREVPYTQATDYISNDSFPADAHEQALDKLTMLTQQAIRDVRTSPSLPLSFDPDNDTRPIMPIPEANKLVMGSSATEWENVTVAELSIADLPVVITAAAAGDILMFNGTNWVDATTLTGNYTFSGDLTLSGANTFSNPVTVGAPTTANHAARKTDLSALLPAGSMLDWPTGTAPSGWLLCDGSAVSRTTYADLFAALVTTPGFSGQTFTVTIASPGVVTKTSHGFTGLERIRLTTSGALPTGLSAGTEYYVIYADADTFKLATSEANAAAGTAINTSGTQSGTHTYTQSLYGLGDGSTTFNLPDFRDVYVRGTPASGATIGTYRKDAMQGHHHTTQMDGAGVHGMQTRNSLGSDEGIAKVNNGAGAASNPFYVRNPTTDGTNGTPRTAAETRPVTRYANKIIKT